MYRTAILAAALAFAPISHSAEVVTFRIAWEMPDESTDNAADRWRVRFWVNGERVKTFKFKGLLRRQKSWKWEVNGLDQVKAKVRGCNPLGCGSWSDPVRGELPARIARPSEPVILAR